MSLRTRILVAALISCSVAGFLISSHLCGLSFSSRETISALGPQHPEHEEEKSVSGTAVSAVLEPEHSPASPDISESDSSVRRPRPWDDSLNSYPDYIAYHAHDAEYLDLVYGVTNGPSPADDNPQYASTKRQVSRRTLSYNPNSIYSVHTILTKQRFDLRERLRKLREMGKGIDPDHEISQKTKEAIPQEVQAFEVERQHARDIGIARGIAFRCPEDVEVYGMFIVNTKDAAHMSNGDSVVENG